MGNKAVTFATNLLCNCWISDVMTGHKAMRTDLFRFFRCGKGDSRSSPRSRHGSAQSGERIYESSIGYAARSREQGKKLTAVDGLRVLRSCAARSCSQGPLRGEACGRTPARGRSPSGPALPAHDDAAVEADVADDAAVARLQLVVEVGDELDRGADPNAGADAGCQEL